MRKNGFTLAEVLITLGIVGVVAALTIPSITANTQNAKIGPKLAKAVSSFEQANESMLNAESVDSITDLSPGSSDEYITALSNYLKGNTSGAKITTKDGVSFTVDIQNEGESSTTTPPHKVYRGMVTIDINPSNDKTNAAEDTFYFGLFDDGSLIPKGQSLWNGTDTVTWETKCPADAEPSDPQYCAGHIFENNLKVLYK